MKTEILPLVVLAVIAAGARWAVATSTPQVPLVSDMQEYWERGVYIAQHGRLYENSWRMPGLPMALAAAFKLAGGPSLLAARWLNILTGAAATVLTYLLARRSAKPLASLCAALAVALYPSFLLYTSLVASETLVLVPLLGALLLGTFSSPKAAVGSGALAALTTLVRPAGVAVLPAVLLRRAAAGPTSRHRVFSAAATVAAFAIVLCPWWMHSWRLYRSFVPLDTTGGINLLIGSGPLADGKWRWRNVSRLHSEYLAGVDVTTPSGSSRAAALAVEHVRENPAAFFALIPSRFAGLFALEGREHAYAYSIGYFGRFSAPVVKLWGGAVIFAFPVLFTLATIGCCVRSGIDSRLESSLLVFIVSTVLMHLLSFGDPRFHLPLVPVLAVLATGLSRWRNGLSKRRLTVGLLILGSLVVPWSCQASNYWEAVQMLCDPTRPVAPLSFDDLI